jgi:hypothetical protein
VTISQASRSVSREATTASPSVVSPAGTSTAQQPSSPPEDAPVNMLHVEFVHNLSSKAIEAFNRPDSLVGVPFQYILRYGLDAPYLMNELLSLSALHLSITKPAKRNFYEHHSTQLQNYALSSFNASSKNITDENTVPIFLFAGVLGLHKLCETLVCRNNDFENFLDRFVQYVTLHRGVRTIISQGRWEFLQQTELKPLLELGDRLPSLENTLGPACQRLLDLINRLALNDSISKTYCLAVQATQSVMTVTEGRVPGANSLDALVAWTLLVPPEYIDLLAERRGEALVILAHYGALVNTHRQQWLFGDGGEYLVRSISQYLGPDWEEWLHWPQQILMEATYVHE